MKRHKYLTLAAFGAIILLAAGLYAYKYNGASPIGATSSDLAAINMSTTEKDLKFSRVPTSGKVFDIAISPDGKYVAYVNGEANQTSIRVRQLQAQNDTEIVPAPSAGRFMHLSFSPDGNSLYYLHDTQADQQIFKIATAGGLPTKIADHTDGGAAVSYDGTRIAFSRMEGDDGEVLAIADADGSNERVLARSTNWREGLSCDGAAAWSPDGSRIACWVEFASDTEAHTILFGFNLADGSKQPLTEQRFHKISGAVWLQNGNLLLAAQEKSGEQFKPAQIWLVTPAGDAKPITADTAGYTRLSATTNGETLVTLQTSNRRDLWALPKNDVSRARQITYSGELGGGYSLMPDGRIVISSTVTGNYDLWMLTPTGTDRKQLTGNEGANVNPRVTPDGRYIFFQSNRTG